MCVSVTEGFVAGVCLRLSALFFVWHMCLALPVCQESWKKKRATSKFLLWYQVVSCYCVEVKRGQHNPAEVRETERREVVEQSDFQASHWSWNFKNFERSDPNSETSNLINFLRISGWICYFTGIYQNGRNISEPRLCCFRLVFSCFPSISPGCRVKTKSLSFKCIRVVSEKWGKPGFLTISYRKIQRLYAKESQCKNQQGWKLS